MAVKVDLEWSEGDPCMSVTESENGIHAMVDVRLSQAQVELACAELGDAGPAVLGAWRARVGLASHEMAG